MPFIFLIEFHYSANNAFCSNALWPHLKFIICTVNIFFAYILNSFAPNSVLPTSGPSSVLPHLHVPHICFSLGVCWRGVMHRTWRQTLSHACQPLHIHPSVMLTALNADALHLCHGGESVTCCCPVVLPLWSDVAPENRLNYSKYRWIT